MSGTVAAAVAALAGMVVLTATLGVVGVASAAETEPEPARETAEKGTGDGRETVDDAGIDARWLLGPFAALTLLLAAAGYRRRRG